MTIDEKRNIVIGYCESVTCGRCVLEDTHISKDMSCIDIENSTDAELDIALKLIEDERKREDPITPDYYNDTKIAPIDVIEDWELDFCLGSALKYIKRAGKKDNNPSVQDLRKVIWYVERRIKELGDVTE